MNLNSISSTTTDFVVNAANNPKFSFAIDQNIDDASTFVATASAHNQPKEQKKKFRLQIPNQ